MQAFVRTNIDSPTPLSFAVQKAVIDFKTQIIARCGSAKMLNEEMLRAGHAEIYTQFCNGSEFEDWAIKYD